MALTKEQTASVVMKFGANEKDTGNTRVQIALLTDRIRQLTEVGQSRRLLKYYKRTNLEGYRALIKELGLRK